MRNGREWDLYIQQIVPQRTVTTDKRPTEPGGGSVSGGGGGSSNGYMQQWRQLPTMVARGGEGELWTAVSFTADGKPATVCSVVCGGAVCGVQCGGAVCGVQCGGAVCGGAVCGVQCGGAVCGVACAACVCICCVR
jgi:hypothetical protein